MIKVLISIFKLLIVSLLTSVIYSCTSISTQSLIDINSLNEEPIGTASDVRMVYTDSMRVSAILTAKKHIDFTNLSFKYSEFPEGVKVTFFDKGNNQSEVTSDYAIIYDATNIVDLRGNVVLKSNTGTELISDQIFWDSSNNWIFTEYRFEYKDEDFQISAIRLDTNKEFSKFMTGKLTGTIAVRDSVQ